METRGVMVGRLMTYLLVLLAASRVAWFSRRLPLDRLLERIRQVPVLPESLQQPEVFQAIVNRWYRWLPPRGLRSCLKRSYLLLDLWTRCGLRPECHLGVRTVEGAKHGHAWLTAPGLDEGEQSEEGYEDAFVA